jgi:hypothetical protein
METLSTPSLQKQDGSDKQALWKIFGSSVAANSASERPGRFVKLMPPVASQSLRSENPFAGSWTDWDLTLSAQTVFNTLNAT